MTEEVKELELKDIAGYLPYGIDFCNENTNGISRYYFGSDLIMPSGIKRFYKPILRPLSDIYKPIIHKGKEIVPIVELAKIAFPYYKFELWNGLAAIIENGVVVAKFRFEQVENYFKWTGLGSVKNLDKLFDYLHELKVDYRELIDKGLAVSVYDLEENPYK